MKIQVLPDSVVNQIAAGEIIERPASVVRELVDNAVDAGADDIAVYVSEGGQSSIRVVDNGCGMQKEDALIAFERHATSKLREADDLLSISTMGFRGEALPSIASISKVRLRTRTAEQSVATEVCIEGGKVISVKETPGPVGTEIEAAALFFNTPARKKFLKSTRTEELRIKQWLLNSALCRPAIRYRLYSDGKEILNLAKKETQAARAAALLDGSTVAFDESAGPCRISGVLAHPSQAEASQQSLVIIANSRVISDKLIAKAVKEGFSGTLKDREFPLGFINIELPPKEIDVNVHPQKSEVRFANPQAVFLSVKRAVERAVREFKLPLYPQSYPVLQVNDSASASYAPSSTSSFGERSYGASASARTGSSFAFSSGFGSFTRSAKNGPTQDGPRSLNLGLLTGNGAALSTAQSKELPFKYSALRFVAQFFACYLFCEHEQTLYVVDMHAAHERINYNAIRNAFAQKEVPSQKLLVPIKFRLSEEALHGLEDQQEVLRGFGFVIGITPDKDIEIHEIPSIMLGHQVESLIKEIAATSLDEDANSPLDLKLDSIAARIACHASVRAGDGLKEAEVKALFAQLDMAEFSAACPHGRPVVVGFSQMDIERWFGRDR